LVGEFGEMSGFRERSGINDGLDEDYVEDDEQDEERRWLKVKKIKCWRFALNTMDMQSNGKNQIKKFRH